MKIYLELFQVSLKHSLIFPFVLQDMFRQVNDLNPLNSQARLPLTLKKKNSGTSEAYLVVKNTEEKNKALVGRVAGNWRAMNLEAFWVYILTYLGDA